jgi:hypothetical protein
MFLLAQDDSMKSVIDKAGPIALLFVLALGVALYILIRSMNKQLKRADENLTDAPTPVSETAQTLTEEPTQVDGQTQGE